MTRRSIETLLGALAGLLAGWAVFKIGQAHYPVQPFCVERWMFPLSPAGGALAGALIPFLAYERNTPTWRRRVVARCIAVMAVAMIGAVVARAHIVDHYGEAWATGFGAPLSSCNCAFTTRAQCVTHATHPDNVKACWGELNVYAVSILMGASGLLLSIVAAVLTSLLAVARALEKTRVQQLDPDAPRRTFERIIRARNPAIDYALFEASLASLRRRICRIQFGQSPVGTGFLIGPDLLMTNHHVLANVLAGVVPASAVRCVFDAVAGNARPREVGLAGEWDVLHSPPSAVDLLKDPKTGDPGDDELDFAVVRLAEAVGDEVVDGTPRGWVHVPETFFVQRGDPLVIAQHPGGRPLEIAIDTEAILAVNQSANRVRYRTNTEPGSSGSPCFDMTLQTLLALHHSGDTGFRPAYNEGIPIHKIGERLAAAGVPCRTWPALLFLVSAFTFAAAAAPAPVVEKKMVAAFGQEYVARGNCAILDLRKGGDVEYDSTFCDVNVQGDITIAARTFADRIAAALDFAERLACGEPGCATQNLSIRVCLRWGQVPFVRLMRVADEGIVFEMSTGLIDLTEDMARALVTNPASQPGWTQFSSWLAEFAARSGKPCGPTKRPSFRAPTKEDLPRLMTMTQAFYVFVFLHELAHIREDEHCGARAEADDLTREAACDEKAFDSFGRLANARYPPVVILPMLLVAHQQALMGEHLAKEERFGDGRTVVGDTAGAEWRMRAEVLLNRWETLCFEAHAEKDAALLNDTTCRDWRQAVSDLRFFLARSLPAPCGESPGAPRSPVLNDPAAVQCVAAADSDAFATNWVRDGEPPVVKVTMSYANRCTRPVRCEVDLQTGTRPVDTDGRSPAWLPFAKVTRDFLLAAGRYRRIDATIPWHRTEKRYPQVRYPWPPKDIDLMRCEFVKNRGGI